MKIKFGNFIDKVFWSYSTVWQDKKDKIVNNCSCEAVKEITSYFFKFFVIQFTKSYKAKGC